MDDIALIDDIALVYINCTLCQAKASLISRPLTRRGSAGGALPPPANGSHRGSRPRARLRESQKLAAAIGALLLGHQSGTSQPASQPASQPTSRRLIAASGVNPLRSISRDENGRPGHPRPALLGATSISCVTPRHLSCAAGRRRRHAPCGQRCLCSYRGCPHWLARRHVWLQADLGPLTPACRQSSAQHDCADPWFCG